VQWRPAAKPAVLRERAALLATLRQFFADRGVLEVETPLLARHGVTDPNIEAYRVPDPRNAGARFLQTSPEYAMKRLVAACGEPVYQICKAFREGEAGSRHNPEFSLLEWYRPGFDHHGLMAEVAELVTGCLGSRPLQKFGYRELFLERLRIDPFSATVADLEQLARRHLDPGDLAGDRDLWLDLLMSHVLQPGLGAGTLCFVYDYPPSQAALARIDRRDGIDVGQRFELFVDGMELANGYYELTDPREQRRRFEADNTLRRARGQAELPVDDDLLAALEHGLPACSGVALGIDRLLMLKTGATDISEVLAFDWERA